MKIFIRIIFILLPVFSFGQNLDSLKSQLKIAQSANDTSCYKIATEIIEIYENLNPDSAIKYIDEAIFCSNRAGDLLKEAEFLSLKGDIYFIKMDYYQAVDIYFEVLKLIDNQSNTNLYGNVLIKLAKTLIKVGFKAGYSKKYLFQAKSIFEKTTDTIGKINVYFVLSYIYSIENNLDSALLSINNALALSSSSNNSLLKAETFYYFSKIYIENKDYLKATTYLKKSLSLSKGTNLDAKYLDCLADVYVKMGFYSAAQNMYNSALLDFNDQNNLMALNDVYLDLSKLSLLQNSNDTAIKYCQEALKISKNLNLLLQQQEAYYTLSLIYSNNQQIDLALHSYKKYSELRDFLFSAKTNNEAELLYSNYVMQIKLQDQQILYNQKEYQVLKNQQQRLVIYILAFFGVLLIIIVFILLRMYMLRKNSEQRLKQLTEVTLEGVIIHDGDLILEVNDKFCEISGFQRNDVVGENLFMILPKKSQEIVRQKLDMKRTVYYQLEMKKKDGNLYNTELLSKPIIFKGIKSKIVSVRDLTEISKMKEKLHATTVKFEALIETSPDGVVITDYEGTITYVSPAFVELFGDKTIDQFIGYKLFDFVTPLYRNKIIVDIKNILYGDYCGVTEYVAKNSDGDDIYLECNGDVLRDINERISGVFMIVRDVTERKLSENALIESESRFRGLFNSSKDAIIIQNIDMKIADANPKASELFQYSNDQLIAMDFRELLPPENRKINLQEYEEKVELLESFAFTKSRKKIYVQISVSKLVYDKDNYYLLTIRDMTLFKRQEDNLKRIATKLQASNATKDKMFSIISHDLRGPIGNLKSMIEFIAENPSEFDMNELIEIITSLRESSTQTYELLENLLSWAKSQQNLLEFQPDIYNLSNLIQTTVKFADEIAKSKGITIQTIFPENNTNVVGDENMIKAILRNIISNAIKFSHENETIEVSYEPDTEFVVVRIQDFGVGIPEDNLSRIFDESTYFSTYGTNNEKGSGLGLKLCSEFVKKNNGKIWVESEHQKGTSFYFTLKIAN
ncbi:MAG: PAS domain S-box protein [Bacteroidales bacterium]|nr:PAS domain S-box protein [Bacteroidales bacterium]